MSERGAFVRLLREYAGRAHDNYSGRVVVPEVILSDAAACIEDQRAELDRQTTPAAPDAGLRAAAGAVVDAVAAWHLPTTVGSPRLGSALIALRAALSSPETTPAPDAGALKRIAALQKGLLEALNMPDGDGGDPKDWDRFVKARQRLYRLAAADREVVVGVDPGNPTGDQTWFSWACPECGTRVSSRYLPGSASPETTPAGVLDEAWAAAEKALPEGASVGVTKTVKVASGPYVATTDYGPVEHGYAYGPTPAAALHALAAALGRSGSER